MIQESRAKKKVLLFLTGILFIATSIQTLAVSGQCPPELLSFWPLSAPSGSIYNDLQGSADGACDGQCPETILDGVIGSAQRFDGVTTGISVADSTAFNWNTSQSFTIEFWMRRSNLNLVANEAALGRASTTGPMTLWAGLLSTGEAAFTLIANNGDGGAADQMLRSARILTDNHWHHIVAVRDASNNRNYLYVDSQLADLREITYGAGFDAADEPLTFGRVNTTGVSPLNGDVDEIAIYQRALLPIEVEQHFNDAKVGLKLGYCPQLASVSVMPLGNSITYDTYTGDSRPSGLRAGYRQQLWLALSNAGYTIDFIGNKIAGQDSLPPFDPDNAGFPGIEDDQLALLLQTGINPLNGETESNGPYLPVYPPDIILLHIGTNGLEANVDGVIQILDTIDSYSTDIPVVISKIINRVPFSQLTSDFNQLLEEMIQSRINAGDRLLPVDMEFDAGLAYMLGVDMIDSLHPNQLGYFKMANVWLDGLKKLLPMPTWSAPQIISPFSDNAGMGQNYYHQVRSNGFPLPVFSLMDGPNPAPAGMTIDPQSGIIQWIPDAPGTVSVTVQAANALGMDSQVFTLNVTDTLIIDNSDPVGTQSTGTWLVSGGVPPYGADSVYSNGANDTFSFHAPISGIYEVSMWWTTYANRCPNVEVEIYDGTTLLDRIYVDQLVDGGQFNLLGLPTYEFTGAAEVRIVSPSSCTTNADAVRFVDKSGSPPVLDRIEIEGPGAVNENSTAQYLARAYYDNGTSRQVAADSWSVDCSAIGQISGDGLFSAGEVDADTLCTITAAYTENTILRNADFEITVNDFVPLRELIIDNLDTGSTASTGTWLVSGGVPPYGADSVYSNGANDTFSFQAPISGSYEVSMWWTTYANRCSNVEVEIYDGTTLLDRIYVDQLVDGGQFNLLGLPAYEFTGAAEVRIVSPGSCTTNADAVRFVDKSGSPPVLDRIEIEGPGAVNENSTAQYLARAYYDNGTNRQVAADSWSVNCTAVGQISGDGLFSAGEVDADTLCTITAAYTENTIPRSADFNITINDLVPVEALIIDNLDTGSTASTGTWLVSGGVPPYGADSVYSNGANDTFSFQAPISGSYEVSMWWTTYANRCSNVEVRIYNGTTLLDRIYVDQLVDGGQFNLLGLPTYEFTGAAEVRIVSPGRCTTNADAVRFVDKSGPPPVLDRIEIEGPAAVNENSTAQYLARAYYDNGTNRQVAADSWSVNCSTVGQISGDGLFSAGEVDADTLCTITAAYTENTIPRSADFNITINDLVPVEALIIDNLDTGSTASTGTWLVSGGVPPYGADSVYSNGANDTFSFQAPISGSYEVSMWWTTYANRCSNVEVRIYNGTTLLDRIYVDQLVDGGRFNLLGLPVYEFTGAAEVRIVSPGRCTTNADAVRFTMN